MAIRTIGFPWSAALVQRTLRITGATLQCTDDVLSQGGPSVAGNLAGGTHHAFAGHGKPVDLQTGAPVLP